MMKKAKAVALTLAATALLGASTVSVLTAAEHANRGPTEHDPTVGATDVTPVMVVNNHLYAVSVYAFDEDGERHKLGRIARSAAETFEIDEELVHWDGYVLIKVYPESSVPGLGSAVEPMPGVRTRIPVQSDAPLVAFWLEPDLANSFTEFIGG